MRYCAATAVKAGNVGRNTEQKLVFAPFDPDPANWPGMPWRFLDGTEPGPEWVLMTWRQFLVNYMWHRIDTMLGPSGLPCSALEFGLLRPRPVRDGHRVLTLKDRAGWGSDPAHAFDIPSGDLIETGGKDDAAEDGFDRFVRPAIGILGLAAVAAKLECSISAVRQWNAGDRRPKEPAKAALAVYRVAEDFGLGFIEDDPRSPIEACAAIRQRFQQAQHFNAATVAWLAPHYAKPDQRRARRTRRAARRFQRYAAPIRQPKNRGTDAGFA